MQDTQKISFRELTRLENARLESALHDVPPNKNSYRKDSPDKPSLPLILTMTVAILLIVIGGIIMFMVGTMLWSNPLPGVF